MLGSARIIVRRGTKPFMECSRQKANVEQWVEAHRKLDKKLHEMSPSTFAELQGYLKDMEELATNDGVLYNHKEPIDKVTKEFYTPFYSDIPTSWLDYRFITPIAEMAEMHNVGPTMFEQDEHNLKYSVDVSGYDPEAITIRLLGDLLIVDAKEEHNDVSENSFKAEVKEFTKSFILPHGTHKDEIRTVLNDEGRLCITIPKLQVKEGEFLKIEREEKKKAEDSQPVFPYCGC